MNAQQRILRFCRAQPRGMGGLVMRTDVYAERFPCAVLDLSRSEIVDNPDYHGQPGGYRYETRDRVVAAGPTWEAVLVAMLVRGLNVQGADHG